MFKKITLVLLILIAISTATFYILNSTDSYDSSKYSVSIPDEFIIGSTIDFALPDQFGRVQNLNTDTRTLIFTFTQDSAHRMREFMSDKRIGYLKRKSAYYVADISTAPVFIRNAFIIPELQQRPSAVILIYEEEFAERFRYDAKKEAIKIVTLDNKKVTNIQFVNTLEELEVALK